MTVGLSQAQGEFVLPSRRPERVLLISGGSGITPVMAMLRTLCLEGYTGEVAFLNYARSSELALYGPELARLARVHPGCGSVADTPVAGTPRSPGGSAAGISRRYAAPRDAATFVCGPPALVGAVRRGLG